jgi:hypothetical protein
MSPFEHGEVFVLDDGGEVTAPTSPLMCLSFAIKSHRVFPPTIDNISMDSYSHIV